MAVRKLKTTNVNFGCLFLMWLFFLTLMEFCIASLNVNGARDSRKRAELFEVIKQKKKLCYFYTKNA